MEVLKSRGIRGVAEECPTAYIKYTRGFTSLDAELSTPANTFKPKKVYVLFGEPGTGKTRWANSHFPDAYDVPTPSHSNYWFDGYRGERQLLLDDYANSVHETYPWSFFLKLLDGYRVRAPFKGGFRVIKPEVIIITSNYQPDMWYPGRNYAALERRITEIFEFTANDSFTIKKGEDPDRRLIPLPMCGFATHAMQVAPQVGSDVTELPSSPTLEEILSDILSDDSV